MFSRNFIFFYIAVCLATIAVAGEAVPREFSFVVLAALLLFIILTPLIEATQLAVAAIPLYLALPLSATFDSMASWRLVLALLFVVWVIRAWPQGAFLSRTISPRAFFGALLPLERIASALLVVAAASLFAAEEPWQGIKKILFLTNIAFLYVVIRDVARIPKDRERMLASALLAGGAALAAGLFQYAAIIFASLYDFWQWWAGAVIPAFYGASLGELLTESNTWFSYYAASPPTLRMFSVFPDSHSFALFMILASTAALPWIISRSEALASFKDRIASLFQNPAAVVWLGASFGIYFSGSRGTWLAAAVIVFVGLLFLFLAKAPLGFARKKLGVFLVLHAAGSGIAIVFFQNLAFFIELQGCNRYPALCSDMLTVFFTPQGSIGGVFMLLVGAAFASRLFLFLWRKGEVIWSEKLAFSFVAVAVFLVLFPVASGIATRAYGFGVTADEAASAFLRATSTLDVTETSNRARLDIWLASIRAIAERPLLGVGFGNYTVVLGEKVEAAKQGASAHNLYLDVGAETGVLGMVLLFLFFFEILRMGWRIAKIFSPREISRRETNLPPQAGQIPALPVPRLSGKVPRTQTGAGGSNLDYAFAAVFGVYTLWIIGYNFFDVVLLNDKVALLFAALLALFSRIHLSSEQLFEFEDLSESKRHAQRRFRFSPES